MKELSIFIDESGDFGEYDYRSPYYIISMVFHNQSNNIKAQVDTLNKKLSIFNLHNNCIHVAPIVRGEEGYQSTRIFERRKMLLTFISFIKKTNIKYKCFYIEKRHIDNKLNAISKLSKQISLFIKDNMSYFNSFDKIKIYYDNGQIEVNKIIGIVFSSVLVEPEFIKVKPSDYKLFQAADLFCYFKLLSLKLEAKLISPLELYFFDREYDLKRKYLKQIKNLKF